MEKATVQFCTVARGAEVLCERWTPLVVRELLSAAGASTTCIAACRACPPACSRSACAAWRNSASCAAGAGKVWEYSLTEAGEALRPIVMALGHWGARWIGSRLRDNELDAGC